MRQTEDHSPGPAARGGSQAESQHAVERFACEVSLATEGVVEVGDGLDDGLAVFANSRAS
jgi:hypothetical protein